MHEGHRTAIKNEIARRKHLKFIQHLWQRNDKFIVGYHTEFICNRIDKAFSEYRAGKSTYLAIKVPFRHGKSDIVSRYLPPHFLGEFPEDEVIVSGYSSGLVHKFSRFSRNLIRDKRYSELYPKSIISREVANIEEWGLSNGLGKAQWLGIGGSITGSGGNLVILDDFYSGREDSESETIRNKTWEAFTNDLLTRVSPVCIVIVLATPWHVDDIFGRISEKMKNEPNFPQFEELKFPAYSEKYKHGILFPERFSKKWYDRHSAALGVYGTASLLQCDPTNRTGSIFNINNVNYVDNCPDNIRYVRCWDLASSKKEREKDDPDYTVGVKVGAVWQKNEFGENEPILYIDDVIRGQWEAPERDKKIKDTARHDGGSVRIGIEAFAGYKDAYVTIKNVLTGLRTVVKMNLPGDKIAKASILEPIFDAKNIYLKKAPWNSEFLKVIGQFPSGKHDDDVDALSIGAHMLKNENAPFIFTSSMA